MGVARAVAGIMVRLISCVIYGNGRINKEKSAHNLDLTVCKKLDAKVIEIVGSQELLVADAAPRRQLGLARSGGDIEVSGDRREGIGPLIRRRYIGIVGDSLLDSDAWMESE